MTRPDDDATADPGGTPPIVVGQPGSAAVSPAEEPRAEDPPPAGAPAPLEESPPAGAPAPAEPTADEPDADEPGADEPEPAPVSSRRRRAYVIGTAVGLVIAIIAVLAFVRIPYYRYA